MLRHSCFFSLLRCAELHAHIFGQTYRRTLLLSWDMERRGVDINSHNHPQFIFFLRDNRSDTRTGLLLFAATTNHDRLQRSMDSTTSVSRSLAPPMSGDIVVRSLTI